MKLRPIPTRLSHALLLLPAFAALPGVAYTADAKKASRIFVRYDARGAGGDAPATTLERITVTGHKGLASYDWGKVDVSNLRRGDGTGSAKPAKTAKEQETDDKSEEPPCESQSSGNETSGNPVVLYTGNKVEPELDFASDGEMGLFLERTYNHHWSATGLFGNHWLSNFDYSLAFSGDGSVAWAQRPDGRRIKFLRDASGVRWNEDRAKPLAYLVKNADGSYTLYNEERGSEIYNTDGYITLRRNEQGVTWAFTYSNKYLQQVTHSSGRSVQLTWTNGQLTQVTDPAGNIYQYTYTPNIFGAGRSRLAGTVLPGWPTTTIVYHYEDSRYPGGLTGKSFNGVRYSTFAYDANKRAILSEHAGGVERYTFSYAVETTEPVTPPPLPPRPGGIQGDEGTGWCEYEPGSGRICYEPRALPVLGVMSTGTTKPRPVKLQVTETNPLGRRTTHAYEDGRKVSVTGDASPNCPASYRDLTYDANGYENIVSDFTDKLTDFDYDEHGHLFKKVEAADQPIKRTTTYDWDEANNRLTRVTVVDDSETSLSYTPNGRVEMVSVRNLSSKGVANQVRTTRYRYTYQGGGNSGLLATMEVDGPLANDTVTYTYSPAGDLLSVTNGLGHVTAYSGHNGLGQPAKVIGPNGDVSEFTYDGRGRVTAVKATINGEVQTTNYTYDGAGRLASVSTPDNVTTTRQYDAAGRLIREYQPEPGGTYSVKKYSYNNASSITSVVLERTTAVTKPTGTPVVSISGNGANGNYTVAWSGVSGAEYFMLEERFNSDGWAGSNEGLATNKAYGGKGSGTWAYRITACNAEGCTATSAEQSIAAVYAPTTSASVSAPSEVTTGSYTVAWSTVSGATTYKLQESANGGAWTDIWSDSRTNIEIGGRTAGTYDYRVYGCNLAGCGPVSGSVRVTEVDPPTGVPVLTAPGVNTTGGYAVNWNAIANTTAYRLEESASGGVWAQVHDAGTTSVVFSGKSTATPFAYRVRACNAAGCGAYSAIATVQQIIYNAQVTAHNAPSHLFSGDSGVVTVTIANTGNVTWPASGFYFGRNQTIYSMPERIALTTPVAPGQSTTFQYTFRAPQVSSGTKAFHFGGQMIGDGVGWFGQVAPTRSVTVENIGGYCPPNKPYCEEPW